MVTKSALSFMKFFSFNSVKNLWKIVILKNLLRTKGASEEHLQECLERQWES